MLEWAPIFWLASQAALAIIGVEQWRRNVLVAVDRLEHPALILDVWGPLALVLPMLFFAARVEGSVRGQGWLAVGGPVAIAIMALGLALVSEMELHQWRYREILRNPYVVLSWTGAGLLLLLLGAAHDLTLWMGQLAFAVAALLLWINTPEPDSATQRLMSREQMLAGIGMAIVLACAIGQGMIALRVPRELANTSGGLMIGSGAMCLAATARLAGPAAALRLGGWAGAYGVLGSLGLMSLLYLMPRAISAIQTGDAGVVGRVAFGFEAYWLEGFMIMLLAGAARAMYSVPRALHRAIGALLILAGALLAGWRLAEM